MYSIYLTVAVSSLL